MTSSRLEKRRLSSGNSLRKKLKIAKWSVGSSPCQGTQCTLMPSPLCSISRFVLARACCSLLCAVACLCRSTTSPTLPLCGEPGSNSRVSVGPSTAEASTPLFGRLSSKGSLLMATQVISTCKLMREPSVSRCTLAPILPLVAARHSHLPTRVVGGERRLLLLKRPHGFFFVLSDATDANEDVVKKGPPPWSSHRSQPFRFPQDALAKRWMQPCFRDDVHLATEQVLHIHQHAA